MTKLRSYCNFKSARVDTFLFMVGQITGKMFDHPMDKDCVSDLSDPGSCRTGKCCNLKFSCTALDYSAHIYVGTLWPLSEGRVAELAQKYQL